MWISTAYAQGTGIFDQNALVQFLPLILIFVVFYFLLIRPQQRKAKDQKAMLEAGIPALALNTKDVRADFARLSAKGVVFRGAPQDRGPIVSVMFEDTCGNLIHLVQAKG